MKRILLLLTLSLCLILGIVSLTLQTVRAIDDSTKSTDSLPPTVWQASASQPVYTLTIDGAIGAVTDDRIGEAIDKANENNAQLLVVFLDTPGGFTKPTWSIIKKFLNSPIPVAVFVYPSGARAGSAGVYMTYAAHFAAMAPSTNIGAAHPVGGGGEKIDSVMNEKITNDATAQIRALAAKRNRNAGWAERAVRQSVSITNQEALDSNVIEFIAVDLNDLLRQLEGKETDVPAGKRVLKTVGAPVVNIEYSFKHKLLDILTSPDIAFILFSIGGLGIVLELYNPGSIFPGVIGAISLILAFYSFQTLPINWAGVALILLALVLFIAEIKIVSHGLLTVGGVISLFLGGLMLINSVDPVMRVSYSVLITTVVLIGISVGLATWLVIKASKHKPFTGRSALIGRVAEVRAGGFVFVEGALWKYAATEPLCSGRQS